MSLEDTLEGTTDALSDERMDTNASPSSCSGPSASPPAYPNSAEHLVQLVPSGESSSLYNHSPPVTHAITEISSVEVKTVDACSNDTDQYDTPDTKDSDQPRSNGITKKISKALNEKILKKLNQQTMVNHSNNCVMAVSSASCLSGYVHESQSNMHLNTNLQPYSVKNEMLPEYSQMNGDVSPVNDNSLAILPLTTSTMTDHMAQSATTSALCDTMSASLQMPVHTSALQQQTGQYTYPDDVRPVHHLHNVNTTYQSSMNTTTQSVNVTPNRQNSYPPTYTHPNGYMYPALSSPPAEAPDRDSILERYIQQQQFFHDQHQMYPYGVKDTTNYAMKSPDSGYQEPCLSPNNAKVIVSTTSS